MWYIEKHRLIPSADVKQWVEKKAWLSCLSQLFANYDMIQ
jgi:hypothetical protein